MSIQDIQRLLKAPKSQMNTFGNYPYRNCEDILEAVKPLLGDCVLIVSDELVLIGDRYYIRATATLTDGGTQHVATAYARESLDKKGMDPAQITGATSSYARKYALNGLFLIDDTKDADHNNHPPKSNAREPTEASANKDTKDQATYRAQAKTWLLEDCDGDNQRAAHRLTDKIGRQVFSTDDLTIPELRVVYAELRDKRKGTE